MKSGGLLISRRERKQGGAISVIATLRLTDVLFLARLLGYRCKRNHSAWRTGIRVWI
jgi:hypothetical protein